MQLLASLPLRSGTKVHSFTYLLIRPTTSDMKKTATTITNISRHFRLEINDELTHCR